MIVYMRAKKYIFGWLVCGMTIVSAEGSQITLNFDSFDSSRADSVGNPVGPYVGTVQSGTGTPVSVQIFCDDLTHDISVPGTYTEDVETISDLSGARFSGVGAETSLEATDLYEELFYLAGILTSATGTTAADIQDAMWNLTYPLEGNPGADAAPAITSSVQGWLNQAVANSAGGNYSSWVILTDSSNQYNGVQELIYNTGITTTTTGAPEPGTVGMLLGGVGLLIYHRRRLLIRKG
jgi:hypothetical protein